jgi:hypothetical protein
MKAMRDLVKLLPLLFFVIVNSAYAEDSRLSEAIAAFDNIEYEKSFALFLPLANEGIEDAQITIGWFYEYGHGAKQNCDEAMRLYQLIIDKGNSAENYSNALFLMGTVYEVKNCGIDLDKAIYWYQKAAENGSKRAHHQLSANYYNGKGVEQDYKRSFSHELYAAEHDFVPAQVRLGDMYFDGKGVEKDYGKAVYWYQKAGENGDTKTLCHLVYLYTYGIGVKRNKHVAEVWWQKATKNGESPSECSKDES